MKAATILALTILAAAMAFGQTLKPADASSELVQLEKDWADALRRGDLAWLDRITDADWTNTNESGVMRPKPEMMARLRTSTMKFDSIELSDMRARVYGDAAVVTGIFTERGTDKGKLVNERGRFTDTFVRRNGRWQVVATHTSMFPR